MNLDLIIVIATVSGCLFAVVLWCIDAIKDAIERKSAKKISKALK
jgi:hypothetical protein